MLLVPTSYVVRSGGKTPAARQNLEGFDAPEQVGGPGFAGGEGWAPDSKDLRALIHALETFFRFRDRFNGGNPELLSARCVQCDANALPAIFDAKRRTGNRAAETQILRSRGRLEETIRFRGRQKIEH